MPARRLAASRSFAGVTRIALVATFSVAWLPPAALEAQRLTGSRFPPTPPPAIVLASSGTSPSLQGQARVRRRMSCPRARVVGAAMGAVLGALVGAGAGVTTAIIPWPREPGSPEARAANRRIRLFAAGGAVVGAVFVAATIECGGS
jgi:hypothetical protein